VNDFIVFVLSVVQSIQLLVYSCFLEKFVFFHIPLQFSILAVTVHQLRAVVLLQ